MGTKEIRPKTADERVQIVFDEDEGTWKAFVDGKEAPDKGWIYKHSAPVVANAYKNAIDTTIEMCCTDLLSNGCFTGDCPHGDWNDCVAAIKEHIGALRDLKSKPDGAPRDPGVKA